MALVYDREMDPAYGMAVEVAPGVRRLTCPNPGPFTFHGTNSWIIGHGDGPFAVVDPGPDHAEHTAALIGSTFGRISDIFVTHTHRDHSPGVAALKRATGARVAGCGPHVPARPLSLGQINPLDASNDYDFAADLILGDNAIVQTPVGPVRAMATPGHTANHLAFEFTGFDVLAVGDLVMSWSTSIVAPPDGAMADYMASLDRLDKERLTAYLPGHGNFVADGRTLVAGLRAHRQQREVMVVAAIRHRALTVRGIVEEVYKDTDPRLFAAADLSVLAQLQWLMERGVVHCDGAGSAGDLYGV